MTTHNHYQSIVDAWHLLEKFTTRISAKVFQITSMCLSICVQAKLFGKSSASKAFGKFYASKVFGELLVQQVLFSASKVFDEIYARSFGKILSKTFDCQVFNDVPRSFIKFLIKCL
jgi:hypothetical protein